MSAALASLEHLTGGLWPYLAIILFGFLPSEIWRWLAIFLARGLHEDAEILVWVRAVASALLAGVVCKLLLSASGALAIVPMVWRWAALAGGFAAFMAMRRNVFVGIFVGEALLILAAYWFQ